MRSATLGWDVLDVGEQPSRPFDGKHLSNSLIFEGPG
jgi:hypothetical protein